MAVGAFTFILGRRDIAVAGLAAMALTLILSPVHLYDTVLLVPAFFLVTLRQPAGLRILLGLSAVYMIFGHRLGTFGIPTDRIAMTVGLFAIAATLIALLRTDPQSERA